MSDDPDRHRDDSYAAKRARFEQMKAEKRKREQLEREGTIAPSEPAGAACSETSTPPAASPAPTATEAAPPVPVPVPVVPPVAPSSYDTDTAARAGNGLLRQCGLRLRKQRRHHGCEACPAGTDEGRKAGAREA